MKRTATAVWRGGVKDGAGTLTTESGVLAATPYSFLTRFEDNSGTNPEEMIAAAHAGCFTMDLAGRLERNNMLVEKLESIATLSMEKGEKGFSITGIRLEVKAKIANPDEQSFQLAVQQAMQNCPISRLLNTEIRVSAVLE